MTHKYFHPEKFLIFFILIFFNLISPTFAQFDRYWDGGGGADKDWNNPLNWDGNTLPQPSQRVNCSGDTIDISGVSVANCINFYYVFLRIKEGGELKLGYGVATPPDTTISLKNSLAYNFGKVKIIGGEDPININLKNSFWINGKASGDADSLVIENFQISGIYQSSIVVDPTSVFTNLKTGVVKIKDHYGSLVENNNRIINNGSMMFENTKGGFVNNDTLQNTGKIRFLTTNTNDCLINNGFFSNTDSLVFNHCILTHIRNLGFFINNPAGNIISGVGSGAGTKGIWNTGRFENQGKIRMDSVGYIFLQNDNYFLNQNEIKNLKSGIIINTDTLRNLGILTMNEVLDSTFISNKGFLENSGTILLNHGKASGIKNYGYLLNNPSGVIQTDSLHPNDSVSPIGIFNKKKIRNLGNITVGYTFGTAILNNAPNDSIINYGTLTANWFGINGLINENSRVFNGNTGILNIYGTGNFDLSNTQNFGFQNKTGSWLESQGSMNIWKMTGVAIKNENATIKLNGLVQIDSSLQESIHNATGKIFLQPAANLKITRHLYINRDIIKNEDFMQNEGIVEIGTDLPSDAPNQFAIRNLDSLINLGQIRVYKARDINGIQNTNYMSNSGSIDLRKSLRYGIQNSGRFNNQPNAIITIDSMDYSGLHLAAISTTTKFENRGIVTLKHLTQSGLQNLNNTQGFDNYGQLRVFRHVQLGLINTGNASLFDNKSTGLVWIDSSATQSVFRGEGLYLDQASSFINNNLVKIKTTLSSPIQFFNNAAYTNNDSTILFNGLNGYVFSNQNANFQNNNNAYLELNGNNSTVGAQFHINQTFTNNGRIRMQDFTKRAMYMQANFTNSTTGKLHFKNGSSKTEYAIESDFGIVNNGEITTENVRLGIVFFNGSLYNTGLFDFSGVDSMAIYSYSPDSVANSVCGKMILNGKLFMSDFRNRGYADLRFTGISNIANSGLFINNGIMVDRYNSLADEGIFRPGATVKDITNNGIFLESFLGPLSNGIKETANIVAGASAPSVAGNWYLDPALTQLAGTYSTGYFLPNSLANAATNFYFTTNFPGCPKVIEVPHIQNPVCRPKVFIFNNFLGDNNWTKHQNWSTGRQPDYCDKVLMLNSNLKLTVPTGYKIKANSIDTDAFPFGFVLDIQNGAIADFPNNR
ncbi:MAG: hypothetical protein IPP61_07215 [Cytophagaceae bacterium]|nr:hypothetical protein [Cytophagaceae bacterium]